MVSFILTILVASVVIPSGAKAATCFSSLSPDGEYIAAVTVSILPETNGVMSAKICDLRYRCTVLVSAAFGSVLGVRWTAESELRVGVDRDISVSSEDRYPADRPRPTIQVDRGITASQMHAARMTVVDGKNCHTPPPVQAR